MKVAYLLGSLNRGGTETLMLDVLKNSSFAPFDMITVHRKDGVLKEEFYKCGKSICKLAPRFPYDPVYLLKLRGLLLKEKVDLVHAQQILDACYAYWALRGTGIKIVYSIHGYYEEIGKRIQSVSDKVDKTIFVSECQRQYYLDSLSIDRSKTEVIYNGISFNKLILSNRKNVEKLKLKFGMVGNFVAVREQKTVCEFLKLLKDENVSFDFYFVGRRDDSEPWRYDNCVDYCQKNGLSECVHFLGSRSDVPMLLSEWDAFVYSTDHDTFGIAIIEAIATGLPTFVNDYAVMKEVTQDGRWAYLYKTKESRDLLIRFMDFVNNKEVYCDRARKDAETVRKEYSIERHIENLNACYLAL